MSYEYDQYLAKHRSAVVKAYDWLYFNLPEVLTRAYNADLEYQIRFKHDFSKNEPDEYFAYDAYFYGGNRSYEVVQNFRKAWLLHIHRNPHHWQHWVLINDEPDEGEILIPMPFNYIVEMICDWWSFSWIKGDSTEIFKWYDDHKDYMKLHKDTRKTVEDILDRIKDILIGNPDNEEQLEHHGVKGQKWGVKNGPPYPIEKTTEHDTIVRDAIESGKVSKKINPEKQIRHTKEGHLPGRSFIDGDIEYAQELVDRYSGNGNAICINGIWTHRERITTEEDIGIYVDSYGKETKSNKAIIIYSKTGTHIYPVRKEEDDD